MACLRFVLIFLTGCAAQDTAREDTWTPPDCSGTDDDCDGEDDDCDGIPDDDVPQGETCDGLDNDCDGLVDEDVTATFWADADADGYGDPAVFQEACEVPPDFVANDEDCNDSDAAVNPTASESCDGIDNDCDRDLDDCYTGTVELPESDTPLLLGEAEGDEAGFSVAGVGDVDADGFPDVLVGAPGHAVPSAFSGAAYLVRGPITADLGLGSADARMLSASLAQAGFSVGGAGDLDADGRADILVGAPYDATAGLSAGAAFVVYGPVSGDIDLSSAGAVLLGGDPSQQAGRSVDGAGDTDDDGFDDVIVGSPGAVSGSLLGAASVLRGPMSGVIDLSLADAVVWGDTSSVGIGCAVSGAGDVDGDGLEDVVVGAFDDDEAAEDAGAAFVFLGPLSGDLPHTSADAILLGDEPGLEAGWSVAGAGDADLDGHDDVLVGSRFGGAFLVSGPPPASTSLADADAVIDISGSGSPLDGAGDVDADGFPDLVVGAGKTGAWVVFGPIAGTLDGSHAAAFLVGEEIMHETGAAVAAAGDVDADGYADLLVGAFCYPDACRGAAWVVLTSAMP